MRINRESSVRQDKSYQSIECYGQTCFVGQAKVSFNFLLIMIIIVIANFFLSLAVILGKFISKFWLN